MQRLEPDRKLACPPRSLADNRRDQTNPPSETSIYGQLPWHLASYLPNPGKNHMISPVALSVYVSSAVAIKIEMIARSGFKAVQMLVVGYAEFRNRYLSNGGKCRAMGFATGCAVTVNVLLTSAANSLATLLQKSYLKSLVISHAKTMSRAFFADCTSCCGARLKDSFQTSSISGIHTVRSDDDALRAEDSRASCR